MISAGDETRYIGCTLLKLHGPLLGHTKKIQRNRGHDILGAGVAGRLSMLTVFGDKLRIFSLDLIP